MSAQDCDKRGRHLWMAIHGQKRDQRHKLEGASCSCLPEVRCATCDGVLVAEGRAARATRRRAKIQSHVYPAWCASPDGGSYPTG